jgi:carbon monoxide dehydrogenase subunit G
VERAVPRTAGVAGAAFLALRRGPTPAEAALGLTSAVAPTSGAVIGSPATLSLTTKQPPSSDALAQLVFTLTQFPGRTSVEINGKEYRRADFEAQSPAILVESPLPFQTVRSPLRMTGTANTFEATFQYELKDAAGTVLAKHFVTATSGNGIRGTFDVTTPFAVAKAGPGTLTVYENDAATGKRINQVDIPVALVPGAPTPS